MSQIVEEVRKVAPTLKKALMECLAAGATEEDKSAYLQALSVVNNAVLSVPPASASNRPEPQRKPGVIPPTFGLGRHVHVSDAVVDALAGRMSTVHHNADAAIVQLAPEGRIRGMAIDPLTVDEIRAAQQWRDSVIEAGVERDARMDALPFGLGINISDDHDDPMGVLQTVLPTNRRTPP